MSATILYSEKQLGIVYRIYAKHQGIHDVPFISLKDFAVMFEEQQQALIDDLTDMLNGFHNDPTD
tara:strand:- start:1170 stop:1364 length:195 start_codon:yes stop_codon:yes gene_type:complete